MDESDGAGPSLSFPSLSNDDLRQVSNTIVHLFDPSTSSDPSRAKQLQQELQRVQATPEAWGLIAGLSRHEDANVRFFSAHTAQVKISRDWATLPPELHPALLALLLGTLSTALSPLNPLSYQPGNPIVIRKLFGSLASLLLRLPFHLFPHPILTVLQTIEGAAASATQLPPSAPASGYNTPRIPGMAGFGLGHGQLGLGAGLHVLGDDAARVRHKMRLWGLEWSGICVEEIGRAGISEQKQKALRRHIETDVPAVVGTIVEAMALDGVPGSPERQMEMMREAEAACKCAESWIGYGLGNEEVASLLPPLYRLLPLPAAASTVAEILSESVFRYGKGAKILTEPLVDWCAGPGQAALGSCEGDPSEEVIAVTKMLCALVDHSSEWLVARSSEPRVQSFLGTILRLTSWEGTGGVDESLTLAIYPLIQEAIMDSPVFQSPHDSSPEWQVAKQFFAQLVAVTRQKVRWPGDGEGAGLGLDKEDREAFESWRRDAGEVIVGAYYILRDEMLHNLVQTTLGQSSGSWQEVEATLHCIRYSSEGVPLGEEVNLPVLFSEVLNGLSQRPMTGKGEERLRLTVVSVIQAYEEWFKFHADYLLPCLNYLVPSLSSTATISRAAADALKALCDMCRKSLVAHIGAFSELHSKISSLGAEEQVKVIQGITSVIQALSPNDAIGPIEGILSPIIDQLESAVTAADDPGLVQATGALAACFKGLSPSEDDIFDLSGSDEDAVQKAQIALVRQDPRLTALRQRIEQSIAGVVGVWNGDAEVADSISSLVKHSTLSSEDTLISLSPLPLLTLVCAAAERSPSALWLSLAATLVTRINSPPSPLTVKKDKTPEEERQHAAEDQERWNVIADAAQRLASVAFQLLGEQGAGMREHPDVVEAWFKFAAGISARWPGILLRLPTPTVEMYMNLGVLGLSAQERFSLKTASDFFIALFANTRFPSPLEPIADSLLKHYGPQVLRALLLSAGSEGPRSVIPNLAELLASLVTRIPAEELSAWLTAILAEKGFPDPRATVDSKTRLKQVILKSRTTKKMREALHEFALVARGLDNTTYGNATAI